MRTLLKISAFLALVAFAAPSFAQVHLGINFGPPRARIEVRGRAPSRSSRWTAGYYTYNDSRGDYDWNRGRWQEPPSPYHVWVAPSYRAHGDHYDYHEGSWRDRGNHDNGNHDNRNHDNGNHNGREK